MPAWDLVQSNRSVLQAGGGGWWCTWGPSAILRHLSEAARHVQCTVMMTLPSLLSTPSLHPPEQVNVFNDLPIDYPTLRDGISIHW